jgi:hypothetical protein
MQAVGARVEQRSSLLKVSYRARTVSLLILEHRQHGVAGLVIGAQAKDMLKEWNCVLATALILNLDCAFQGWKIIGRNPERGAE